MPSIKKESHKFKPKISGHETFTLKYGWVKKIVDEVEKTQNEDIKLTKNLFSDPSSIIKFGVGKNMINSLKYWAIYTGLINKETFELTSFANDFFNDKGCDPYLESAESVWLIHYNLACNEHLVTYNWFFNKYNGGAFDRRSLLNDLLEQFEKEDWPLQSESTLKRDVECFTRMYSSKNISKSKESDETIESPLRELGLIKESVSKNIFTLNREEKLGLSVELSYYLVLDFWHKYYSNQATLSFNSLLYDQNSIGRICLLNESALNKIIINIDKEYSNIISWAETSGMRQFSNISGQEICNLKKDAYGKLIQKVSSHGIR